MTDMEKVMALYTHMRDRLEMTGHAPYQTQVYSEMIEFLRDCKSAEEATEKIKNSEYYLAPSKAITQDTVLAFLDAAREDDMPDLAAVYQKKLEEIERDRNAMYDGSYQETAKWVKADYLWTMEAFAEIFSDWMQLKLADPGNTALIDSVSRSIRENMKKLKKPSDNFAVLAGRERFRKLVPLSDEAYGTYVAEIMQFANMGKAITQAFPEETQKKSLFGGAQQMTPEEEAIWNEVKIQMHDVRASGLKYLEKVHEASCTATAPADEYGNYTFSDEKIR